MAKRCVHTTDLENELDFGKVMDTLLYLKWITNKDLLYSKENFGRTSHPALPLWHMEL